jgi:hypothetical protein
MPCQLVAPLGVAVLELRLLERLPRDEALLVEHAEALHVALALLQVLPEVVRALAALDQPERLLDARLDHRKHPPFRDRLPLRDPELLDFSRNLGAHVHARARLDDARLAQRQRHLAPVDRDGVLVVLRTGIAHPMENGNPYENSGRKGRRPVKPDALFRSRRHLLNYT